MTPARIAPAGVVALAAWLVAGPAFAQSPEQKLRFKRAHDVMRKHCFGCHGEEKQKGEFRMDSLPAMLKGGESGKAAVVQGHADESPLIARMRLPVADEDVMPPAKKDRPAAAEIAALVEWINDGALWIPEVLGKSGAAISPEELAALHKDLGADAISPQDKALFDRHIEPLFRNNCMGCHGPRKQKAGLRLDNRRSAFAGSENGKVIVPGKPEQSEVFIRLSRSIDHEDVMPPKEKNRVPPARVAKLREWIARGAPWPLPKSKMERGSEHHYSRFFDALDADRQREILELKERGVFIEPLIWKGGGLRAVFAHNTGPLDEALFAKIAGLETQVQWLDLSRQKPTPAVLNFMGRLDNLRVLHLENTGLDDAGLRKLPDFPRLEYLNLHSTKVSDAGLGTLRRYRNLRKLYLWNTGAGEAGVKALKKALPDAEIVYRLE